MAVEFFPCLPLTLFLRGYLIEFSLQFLGTCAGPGFFELPATITQALEPRFDLLRAGLFDIARLLRLVETSRELIPFMLPVRKRLFRPM